MNNKPKALFLGTDGNVYPDYQICSGLIPAELNGKPCPYVQEGCIPDPQPLNAEDENYSPDKGKPGDLFPPCVKHNLSSLGHWQGHGKRTFPEELLPLRLFKCRMWFWLVVPGLYEDDPTQIKE
jgi:hypothetical protein